MDDLDECGLAAMDWLKKEEPYHYLRVMVNYDKKDWPNESTARMIQALVERYSAEGFLSANLAGSGKVAKLAVAIQNYFNNEEARKDNNRLRQANEKGDNNLEGMERRPLQSGRQGVDKRGSRRGEGGLEPSSDDVRKSLSYGVPYQGSKGRIAGKIADVLPSELQWAGSRRK